MLARDVVEACRTAGWTVTAVDRTGLDVTDPAACTRVVADAVGAGDVVVNTAAWTKVDAAEDAEPQAFAVNAVGAANVARAVAAVDARLVHVSTDYVFDGLADTPYAEDAPPAPRSAYGRTKAAGEWAVAALARRHHIVRTAWLYGAGGSSFVRTMARLATERDTVNVVDDQRGQPTWTADLADAVVALVREDAAPGIYHGTSTGEATWYDLAREVFRLLGHDPDRVRPVGTDQYPTPAPRPAYSVLGHDRWRREGLPLLPRWDDALARAVHDVVGGPSA